MRATLLDPEGLEYLAVTDGFAPVFEGAWSGKPHGVYAFTLRNTRSYGGTDGSAPYYRVDGVDSDGEPILVELPTSAPEYEMLRVLFSERGILNRGPETNSHRDLTYAEAVEMSPVDDNAPLIQRPPEEELIRLHLALVE
jgi:hypothetical protein